MNYETGVLEEAEKSAVAQILERPAYLDEVAATLAPTDFSVRVHAVILEGVQEVYKQTGAADFVRLCKYFSSKKQLEMVGGVAGLSALQTTPSSDMRGLVSIIKEASQRRKIVDACSLASYHAAPDSNISVQENIQKTISQLEDISKSSTRKTQRRIGLIARDLYSKVGKKELVERYPSRLNDLNSMFGGGFTPGRVYVIAGRPGMGKTSIALNLVTQISQVNHVGSLVMSAEMSEDECTEKIIRERGHLISLEELTPYDEEKFFEAVCEVEKTPIIINDTSIITPTTIRKAVRDAVKSFRDDGIALKVLMVDYVQLCRSDKPKNSREAEVEEISREMKLIAKEFGLIVLLLSQLSRKVEERDNKRPSMADLRNSGAIEQDADAIIFLFREEFYTRDKNLTPPHMKDKAEVIVEKNRHGKPGTAHLAFRGQFSRFENPFDFDVMKWKEKRQHEEH